MPTESDLRDGWSFVDQDGDWIEADACAFGEVNIRTKGGSYVQIPVAEAIDLARAILSHASSPQGVTFTPGWLRRQVSKSVASLDLLPRKLRRALAVPSVPQEGTDA